MFKKLRRNRISHQDENNVKDNNGSIYPHVTCNSSLTSNTSTATASKLYTYEYNNGENYEVVYDKYGDNPHEVLNVRHFDFIPRPEGKDDVVIIVEASTVSMEDCKMRRGLWTSSSTTPVVSLPNTPGFDIVGKVLYSNSDGIKTGDRVASFLPCGGGNARYITISSSKLITVPTHNDSVNTDIDPTQIACLIRTYIMAFQSLFYGVSSKEDRYDPDSLKGKHILVTAGAGLITTAIVSLALSLGCEIIYVAVNEEYHEMFESLGAIPLKPNPDEWQFLLQAKNIDIVIDGICYDYYKSSRSLIKEDNNDETFKSKVICIGMASHANKENDGGCTIPKYIEMMIKTYCSMFMNKIYFLKLTESWEHNLQQSKDDLEFLIKLLQEDKIVISPKIVARIPLRAVAYAHQRLQNERIDGFIVCEPWLKINH